MKLVKVNNLWFMNLDNVLRTRAAPVEDPSQWEDVLDLPSSIYSNLVKEFPKTLENFTHNQETDTYSTEKGSVKLSRAEHVVEIERADTGLADKYVTYHAVVNPKI